MTKAFYILDIELPTIIHELLMNNVYTNPIHAKRRCERVSFSA